MRTINLTWRLALPALLLVILMQNAAQAQSRWQGNVSLGVAIPYGNIISPVEGPVSNDRLPFGLATTGMSYSLGADYFWKEKTGISLSTGGSFLGYDRGAAGNFFLMVEGASTASVTANSYYLHTFQAGLFHHFAFGEKVELRTALYGGWSVLYTPEISVWLDTEPYTDIYYDRGSASAPSVMVELAPYFQINDQMQLILSASLIVSNPEIEWQSSDGSQSGSRDLSYGILGISAGMAYRFAQASSSSK